MSDTNGAGAVPPRRPMKILLAVDGSDYTQRMLDYVAAHDEIFGAGCRYTALSVSVPIPAVVRRAWRDSERDAVYESDAAVVLKPVNEFAARHGWTLETRRDVGNAGDRIAALATEGGFDLVVMGSHGHGALAGLALGAVATRVAQCRVPVLIVR